MVAMTLKRRRRRMAGGLQRSAAASMAREIAEHLKSGGAPHAHQVTLDVDGAIVR